MQTDYEALAVQIGVVRLSEHLRSYGLTPAKVMQALTSGDCHLNTINLVWWVRAALNGRPLHSTKRCEACGQKLPSSSSWDDWPASALKETIREEPWVRWKEAQSLSGRVSLLKHVACTHFLQQMG